MITANMPSLGYQKSVATFYDHEACSYEERYWRNPVAQKIRQSFREAVKTHAFGNVLEVGCGTGLDLAHFGSIYPARQIYGIDISPAMVAQASAKVRELGLANVRIEVGAPENLPDLFPGVQFDHIYVFFGALNTVSDLQQTARLLKGRLSREGTMVLTFVNKYYLADVAIHLLRFRFKQAFRRFRRVWGGYSEQYYLESRCFSPREISQAFGEDFLITQRRGYSILYPAWFRADWIRRFGRRMCNLLWDADRTLSHTPAWCLGEYALYSFRAKS